MKILVLRIIYVFFPSLSPFIAYCYRRNTVYPSSFNLPVLILLLKSRMFSTLSNFWLLKYSPVQTRQLPARKKWSEERCFVKFWTNIYVKMFKQPKLGGWWNWPTDYFHVRRKSWFYQKWWVITVLIKLQSPLVTSSNCFNSCFQNGKKVS